MHEQLPEIARNAIKRHQSKLKHLNSVNPQRLFQPGMSIEEQRYFNKKLFLDIEKDKKKHQAAIWAIETEFAPQPKF